VFLEYVGVYQDVIHVSHAEPVQAGSQDIVNAVLKCGRGIVVSKRYEERFE
jgi:hypothetical protein